jgi:hypothetical protein
MTIAISNKQTLGGLLGQVKRLSGFLHMQRMYTCLREYHRSQRVLDSSYQSYRIARGMPMRIWKRHSALFMSMDEKKDSY